MTKNETAGELQTSGASAAVRRHSKRLLQYGDFAPFGRGLPAVSVYSIKLPVVIKISTSTETTGTP